MVIELVCGISPHDDTRTTMWGMKRRILRFAHQNGRLPSSVDELPRIPNMSDKITDWWGNPIHFEVTVEGVVILRSAGGRAMFRNPSEGKPLVRSFPSKTPKGEWADEMVHFYEEDRSNNEEQ